MTIAAYFRRRDAQRVLLLHIQRSDAAGTCYHLSDTPYATDPADTPANLLYSPLISTNGIPELSRTLNEPFDGGGASTAFGNINLAPGDAAYTTTAGAQGRAAMTLPRGAAVTLLMAAPRTEYPPTDAVVLAVGKVNRVGGSSTGACSIEIIDAGPDIAQRPITIDTAVGPMTFGYARNMTPFLVDPATLKYAVHTGAVEDIVQVYDDDVPVAFTKSNATGTFTLSSGLVGTITCDVKGAKVSGTWLTTTTQIVGRILDLVGVSGITRSMALPAGTIGFVISASTTAGEVLGKLTAACAGYWLIDRDGDFIAGQYPVPGSGGPEFTLNETLGEVEWKELGRLYKTIHYSYRPNWTPNQQAKPAATTAQATFAAGTGLASSLNITPLAELLYAESPVFPTYFDAAADAQAVAQVLLDFYSVIRKTLQVPLPYTDTLSIGGLLTLIFNSTTHHCAAVGVGDVFDGTYPQQRMNVVS